MENSKKQTKLLKKLLSMKSTILIESRAESLCSSLSFLGLFFGVGGCFHFVWGKVFSRALLHIEGKPGTTVYWDSRANKHHHEEVH